LNGAGLMIGKEWGGTGNLNVQGSITIGAGQIFNSPGRMHIDGPEYLYLLNRAGVVIGKDWGGTGNLMVHGTILTSKVKVAAFGSANWSWADYVFAKDYKLKSLPEVEAYIKANKHLEGMPTSEEVKKDGIDIAPVTAKLLEKIEELTLYMIEMKKENEALKKDVKFLKTKLQ
jgi:trimeric autotransporter adhesin